MPKCSLTSLAPPARLGRRAVRGAAVAEIRSQAAGPASVNWKDLAGVQADMQQPGHRPHGGQGQSRQVTSRRSPRSNRRYGHESANPNGAGRPGRGPTSNRDYVPDCNLLDTQGQRRMRPHGQPELRQGSVHPLLRRGGSSTAGTSAGDNWELGVTLAAGADAARRRSTAGYFRHWFDNLVMRSTTGPRRGGLHAVQHPGAR